jgi:bacillithiol synthase
VHTHVLPYDKISGGNRAFSRLFLEYISHAENDDSIISRFFSGDYRKDEDTRKLLERLTKREYNRPALVSFLKKQNMGFGCNGTTLRRIDGLRSPNAVAIVTGQQVGLMTGSLYTIYKTLSAIVLSEQLKARFPAYNFVPIFWLEGEDHDYDEAASVSVLSENQLKNFRYDEKTYTLNKSVGRTRFSEDIQTFTSDFLSALPPSSYREVIGTILHEIYKPGETFETAFAKTMMRLFSDDGLILCSSNDPEFKQLAKPVFIRELETSPQSSQNVISQSAQLEEKGYEVQAKTRPVNLYLYENDQRSRIEPAGKDAFTLHLGRARLTKSELLELAHGAPERFSPNVILRPIVQDSVLPTLAYIAGPGEIAYFAQYRQNYEFFNIPMPFIVPRASLTLIEPKNWRVFEKISELENRQSTKETIAEFFASVQEFLKDAINAASTVEIDLEFSQTDRVIQAEIERLASRLGQIDPTLRQSLEKTASQISHQFDGLKGKSFRAEKQKHAELVQQIEKCEVNLFPAGVLQERAINIFYFLNKFDLSLIQRLKEVIKSQSAETGHLIVEL